jgi:SUKH-4 immunity protein
MSPQEARQLLLDEGLSENSIPVTVRMGDDPGELRLAQVLKALAVVIEHTKEDTHLDRDLMMALWAIAYHGEFQSESWQKNGRWRNGRFNEQITEIALYVERYISGDEAVDEVSELFADRWARKWKACGFEDVGIEMVPCGNAVLPDSAAPCLTFAEKPLPVCQVFRRQWSAEDRERLAPYQVIGSDGAGNPICTEDGKVVLLDHEDRFTTKQFVNSSVHCLAECLLAFMGEKNSVRFREAVVTIDPSALEEGTFWWHAARGLETP